MAEMTIDQAISKFLAMNDIDRKYGWKPEFRKIHSYVNKTTRKRFQKHVSPAGIPWEKTIAEKKIKSGDTYFYEGDGYNKAYPRKATKRNSQEWRALNKRKRRAQKALYRRGKNKKTALYEMMTKPSARGHVFKLNNTEMTVGTYSRTAEKLQKGGMAMNGRIPARPFYGLTAADKKEILNIIQQGLEKKIKRIFK